MNSYLVFGLGMVAGACLGGFILSLLMAMDEDRDDSEWLP